MEHFPSSFMTTQESVVYAADNCVPLCVGCGMKTVVGATPYCSRRCSWSASGRCPQCGRPRDPAFAYCSSFCSQQALQANWCPCCGTCQIALSGGCSNQMCSGSTMFLCNDNRKKKQSRTSSQVLSAGDPVRASITNSVAQGGVAGAVEHVVKVNSSASNRRRYLSYRSSVEAMLSANSVSKYGHGGEGNEQKRYIPVQMACRFDISLRNCGSSNCEFCTLMSQGLSLGAKPSHYATSSFRAAAECAMPNHVNQIAVLVCRAVIGSPSVLHLVDERVPEVEFPADDSIHSTIVTNGDASQDGTYLFSNDAVDPLHVVVLRSDA